MFTVLDLFSAACGGWSLGLHRAGFRTVAACEAVEWRRTLYRENNPDVRFIYDDVCTLTGARLRQDLGFVPDVVVGSPPCQDISSANTKGKGVDGARSGLFFEAIRIIGEVRPRWFALENSPLLRTRGADRVVDALAAIGYACEPFVVGADDAGANHERKRSWLIGWDTNQVVEGSRASLLRWSLAQHARGADLDAAGERHEGGRPRGHGSHGDGAASVEVGVVASGDAAFPRLAQREGERGDHVAQQPAAERAVGSGEGDAADAGQQRLETGRPTSELQAERRGLSDTGSPGERRDADGRRARLFPHANGQGQPDVAEYGEVGGGEGAGEPVAEPWADWNGGLASHLWVDDGLSAWLAGTRVAVGGPRGTAAASLLVEAFGDSVVPAVTEAIGRAILRTEAALAALYGRDVA